MKRSRKHKTKINKNTKGRTKKRDNKQNIKIKNNRKNNIEKITTEIKKMKKMQIPQLGFRWDNFYDQMVLTKYTRNHSWGLGLN